MLIEKLGDVLITRARRLDPLPCANMMRPRASFGKVIVP
jgi:hypothetical protein